jgi:hypothetical protein
MKIMDKFCAIVKGYLYRRNNLPNSIKFLQKILINNNFSLNNENDDGRTNSSNDENIIIQIIKNNVNNNRLWIPNKRHWFDISIKDYHYGWLPINIKTTKIITSDNIGNLAMCLYSLTNENMDLHKSYNNGIISKKLINHLKENNLNFEWKKDYYFLVINKNNNNDIIINSYKGFNNLTPNINNLPFQIKWRNNRDFIYYDIFQIKKKLLQVLQKPKESWKETFLNEIRNIY